MALALRVVIVNLLGPMLGRAAVELAMFGFASFTTFMSPILPFAWLGSVLVLTPAYALLKKKALQPGWRYLALLVLGMTAGGAMLALIVRAGDWQIVRLGGLYGLATALGWVLMHKITRTAMQRADVPGQWAETLGIWEIFTALACGLVAFAGVGWRMGEMSFHQPPPRIAETKDRLPEEAMDRLVAAAMAQARGGDLAAAEALFERQLAAARETKGPGSVDEADLLMAFGVQLFTAGADEELSALRPAAAPYLARSIDAYRAAFGPDSAEVAVALNSHADVLLLLHYDGPVAKAEAELEEALRIRTLALGRSNAETIATRRQLAQLHGHPSRVQGDGARLAAVTAEFEAVIAEASGEASARNESAPLLRLALAQMYLDNGEVELAKMQLRLAKAGMASWSEAERAPATFQLMILEAIE